MDLIDVQKQTLATASITRSTVVTTTVPAPTVTVLATELPGFVGNHKGLFNHQNGGDLNSMYDSYRFDSNKRSREAATATKKDKKSYRPWQGTGSVVKQLTEPWPMLD